MGRRKKKIAKTKKGRLSSLWGWLKFSLFLSASAFLGVLANAIIGWVAIYDRLSPPHIEVLALQPIAIREMIDFLGVPALTEGAGAIVRVRNDGSRIALISSVDLACKIYHDLSTYISYTTVLGSHTTVLGRSMDDIDREYNSRKPYSNISYSSWPSDSPVAIRLEAGEERFIKFTFREPSHLSGSELHKDLIGFEDDGKVPSRNLTRFDMTKVFDFDVNKKQNRAFPVKLKNEIITGQSCFYLRVGIDPVKVDPQKIAPLKIVLAERWEQVPAQEIFHSDY